MKTIVEHPLYGTLTYDTGTDKVTVQKGDLAERLTWVLHHLDKFDGGGGYHPGFLSGLRAPRRLRGELDVGGAQGCVAVQIALAHPHLAGGNFELPVVGPIFEEYVQSFGLEERLSFYPGDFFKDSLPSADVIIMGHILHDWGLEEKRKLIAKAHAALPKGGALIVYEAIIDDERQQNTFGLLMSLNMLIETQAGFDFTGADCSSWMRDAGFKETRVEPLCGPDSMVVGIK